MVWCQRLCFQPHTVLTPHPTLQALSRLHALCSYSSLPRIALFSSLDHCFWALMAQALRFSPAWLPPLLPFPPAPRAILWTSMFTRCLKIRNQIGIFLGSSQPTPGFSNPSRANIFSTVIPWGQREGLGQMSIHFNMGHKPAVPGDGQGSACIRAPWASWERPRMVGWS